MAVNFQTFNPEQMAVAEALAKQLEAEPLLHEFVEFIGCWLPKLTYQQALRHNMLDRVDVVEMQQELGGMIRAMMEARGATRH